MTHIKGAGSHAGEPSVICPHHLHHHLRSSFISKFLITAFQAFILMCCAGVWEDCTQLWIIKISLIPESSVTPVQTSSKAKHSGLVSRSPRCGQRASVSYAVQLHTVFISRSVLSREQVIYSCTLQRQMPHSHCDSEWYKDKLVYIIKKKRCMFQSQSCLYPLKSANRTKQK